MTWALGGGRTQNYPKFENPAFENLKFDIFHLVEFRAMITYRNM